MRGHRRRAEPVANQVLLTIEQAAQRLALGRTTVYSLIQRGELKSVRIGRAVRVRTTDLDAFAAELTSDLR